MVQEKPRKGCSTANSASSRSRTATKSQLKPILKWVGGKRQLLSEILPRLPENPNLYIEPFVGGGAVLLGYRPERAVINDANPELINVYRVVRDEPRDLISLLAEHAKKNCREYFYEVRGLDRAKDFVELSDVERAARIIYLNKTCFNGLYRVNSAGQINTPYGRYKNPKILDEEAILALIAYLAEDISITCGDYSAVLKDLPEGAVVYLDPPYMPLSATASFTGYTEGGFNYLEQVRLRDECRALSAAGVTFLQSNSDTPLIRELYSEFEIFTVEAKRAINSRSDRRGPVTEVLIRG